MGKIKFLLEQIKSELTEQKIIVALMGLSSVAMPAHAQFSSAPFFIYDVRENGVFYAPSYPIEYYKIEGADPKTFKVFTYEDNYYLNKPYARDKNHIYYYAEIIKDADVATFDCFKNQYGSNFCRDKNHVYLFGSEVLKGADPETFSFLEDRGGMFFKDKNHVYTNSGEIFEGADAATFIHIEGSSYYKDKHSVYWLSFAIEGADPDTFVIIDNTIGIGRDKNNVYVRQYIRSDLNDDYKMEIIAK